LVNAAGRMADSGSRVLAGVTPLWHLSAPPLHGADRAPGGHECVQDGAMFVWQSTKSWYAKPDAGALLSLLRGGGDPSMNALRRMTWNTGP